ncbi:MAG: hypothetical protein ACUVYA_20245, partial [Planctomycetota bacterium]
MTTQPDDLSPDPNAPGRAEVPEDLDPESEAATRKIPLSDDPAEGLISESRDLFAASGEALDAAPTQSVPEADEVEFAPTQSVPEADEVEFAPTESVPQSDDVYVILPDGVDVDAPLVETEALRDEAVEGAAGAEVSGPTPTERMTEEIPQADASAAAPAGGPGGGPDVGAAANLAALASELDEAVLASEEDEVLAAGLPAGVLGEDEALALEGGAGEDAVAGAGKVGRGRGSRLAVLAAAAAVAAACVYLQWPSIARVLNPSPTAAGQVTVPPPAWG